MAKQLCLGCMREVTGQERVCPVCGHQHGVDNGEAYALRPGSVLNRLYLVGDVIGQGGFGITYVGYDMMLQRKVAIKEYFPMGMVTRDNRSTVVWSQRVASKSDRQRGYDSFLKEARKMARLEQISDVVGVHSVFSQNETAYIVMDFVEGETLKTHLARRGAMTFEACIKLLSPIMEAMESVHRAGIIHRDISPDNMMLRKNGKLALLDLGAAKDIDVQHANGTVSSQLVAKHGFSPPEQYMDHGNVGSWTDVYAMCATIYYCVTGKLPPKSIDRSFRDSFAIAPPLTQAEFEVLNRGMSIYPENRIRTMAELLAALKALHPDSGEEMNFGSEEKRRMEEALRRAEEEKLRLEDLLRRAEEEKHRMEEYLRALGEELAHALEEKRRSAKLPGSSEPVVKKSDQVPMNPSTAVNVMRQPDAAFGSGSYFWGQERYKRAEVRNVKFISSLMPAPENAFDVSKKMDRTVLAWMKDGTLYVGSDGIIALNQNSSKMFSHFENVETIDFGERIDTSNVTNMESMFDWCPKLKTLDLSCFNTDKVTDMHNMFYWCTELTNLYLGSFNTSSVTNMQCMFSNCRSLRELNLNRFNTAIVTDMSYMFLQCAGLRELDLSSFNTARVTDMSHMFDACAGLTALNLSSFDTGSVTRMNCMFRGCWLLRVLNLSSFKTGSVVQIEKMFSDCSITNLRCTDQHIRHAYENR